MKRQTGNTLVKELRLRTRGIGFRKSAPLKKREATSCEAALPYLINIHEYLIQSVVLKFSEAKVIQDGRHCIPNIRVEL